MKLSFWQFKGFDLMMEKTAEVQNAKKKKEKRIKSTFTQQRFQKQVPKRHSSDSSPSLLDSLTYLIITSQH